MRLLSDLDGTGSSVDDVILGAYSEVLVALPNNQASVAVDLALGNNFELDTPQQATTLTMANVPPSGVAAFTVRLVEDSPAAGFTFPASWSAEPTVAAGSEVVVAGVTYDGGVSWTISTVGQAGVAGLSDSMVVAESFDKADGALGPDESWTVAGGLVQVVSNTARSATDTVIGVAVADTTVAVDAYAEADVTVATVGADYGQAGVIVRGDGTDQNYYCGRLIYNAPDTTVYALLSKVVGGTNTDLGTLALPSPSLPIRVRLTVVGDRLSLALDGDTVLAATDSALTAGTDVGVEIYYETTQSVAYLDAFEAGTPPTSVLVPYPGAHGDGSILHVVDATPVWVAPAAVDAVKIQGVDVTVTAVGDDEVLAYDSGTGDWVNQTAAEAGLEAAGAAASAVSSHEGAGDPHAGYVLESDHTKAAHDALLIDADTLDGVDSTGFATAAQGALADSALQDVVDDATPTLGGTLDANSQQINNAFVGGGDSTGANNQLQLRSDTAANWTSNDPTLAVNEAGVESDTGRFKIGDGATAWTGLGYAAAEDAHAHVEADVSDLDHDAVKIRGVGVDATVGSPGDGDILVYRAAGTDWVLEAKPSGANPALNDVTDVTIASVADNEVLAYDNGTSEWVNQTPPEAGLATSAQGALADSASQPGHAHAAADVTSGTLGVPRGGSGVTSVTTNSYLRGQGAAAMQERTAAETRADIGANDAGNITAGTLAVARGGTGIASYTTNNYVRASGATSLEQRTPAQVRADVGADNAANITSGTLPVARGGTGLATVTSGNFLTGNGTGAFNSRTPAQARADVGADNASNLASGTVGTARLGSGTADTAAYLRGDQTWQNIDTRVRTNRLDQMAAPTAAVAMNSQLITGLAAGTTNGHAVRYEQLIGQYLPLTGGTLSGALAMGGSKVTGLAAATANGDAVRYEQAVLKASFPCEIGIAVSDETTALTTGTAKATFRMPYAMTVTAVRASLTTASSSGDPTFDINEGGSTILSTKLSIDASEKTSTTAVTAAVISDSALADDAEITIDIDAAGTGAAGAKVWLIGTRSV